MNLTTVLSLIVLVGSAFVISPVLGNLLGRGPFLFLLPIIVVEGLLLWIANEVGRKGRYPKCHNGKCQITNRDIVPAGDDSSGITFRCQCGQTYRLQGNRFLIVDPNTASKTRHYMARKNRLASWQDDRD